MIQINGRDLTLEQVIAVARGGEKVEMTPESKSQVIASDEEGHHALYGVGKMERVFGLSFDSHEDLKDHIAWNLARAKAAKEGKDVHNVLHVW